LSGISPSNLSGVLSLARRLATDRRNAEETLDLCLGWYRDLLVVRATGDPDRLVNCDRVDEIVRLSAGHTVAGLTRVLERLAESRRLLAGNVNLLLTMENLLIGIARESRAA
jgi:DNA polymerase-3 subunit delta'